MGDDPSDDILVDFPFELVLEHKTLDLKGMFEATTAFDQYEVGDAENEKDLTVDVLAVYATETHLRITPERPLTYTQISQEVQDIVKGVAKSTFEGSLKAKQLHWHLVEFGVSSDQRRNYRRVA